MMRWLRNLFNNDELKAKFTGYNDFAEDKVTLLELPKRLNDLKYASAKTPSVKRCKIDLTQDLDEILKPSPPSADDDKTPSISNLQRPWRGVSGIIRHPPSAIHDSIF